jgi:hypothetical protein
MSNLTNEQPPSPAMQIAYLDDTLKRVKVILEVPVWSQEIYNRAMDLVLRSLKTLETKTPHKTA